MVSDVGKWGLKLFEKEKPVQQEVATRIPDEQSPSEKSISLVDQAVEEPKKSEDNIVSSAVVVEEVIVSSPEPAVEAEVTILEEPSKSEVNVQATELPLPEMEHIICQLERGTVVRRSLSCPKISIEEHH